jgi:hypothetical protein
MQYLWWTLSLEHVSRSLLFRLHVSIISPVPSTHLMLVIPEGQADESLEPLEKRRCPKQVTEEAVKSA